MTESVIFNQTNIKFNKNFLDKLLENSGNQVIIKIKGGAHPEGQYIAPYEVIANFIISKRDLPCWKKYDMDTEQSSETPKRIFSLPPNGQINMEFTKVNYQELNAKQKENYNYHKVASALADYGYDSMRLNNDWEGADFIAVMGDDMLKVQLKGRFTIDKKYIGKDLYVAFLESNAVKIYNHDLLVQELSENIIDRSPGKSKDFIIGERHQCGTKQLSTLCS